MPIIFLENKNKFINIPRDKVKRVYYRINSSFVSKYNFVEGNYYLIVYKYGYENYMFRFVKDSCDFNKIMDSCDFNNKGKETHQGTRVLCY
jgi:phage anti-repressor protein